MLWLPSVFFCTLDFSTPCCLAILLLLAPPSNQPQTPSERHMYTPGLSPVLSPSLSTHVYMYLYAAVYFLAAFRSFTDTHFPHFHLVPSLPNPWGGSQTTEPKQGGMRALRRRLEQGIGRREQDAALPALLRDLRSALEEDVALFWRIRALGR